MAQNNADGNEQEPSYFSHQAIQARMRARKEARRRRREDLGPRGIAAQERADRQASRDKKTQGVDLVALALEKPQDCNEPLRLALLGRPAYRPDADAFLAALRGYDRGKCGGFGYLGFSGGASSSVLNVHQSAELCKWTLCDWRIPDNFHIHEDNVDANVAVEVMYQEQLRLEREHDPLERAREVVRNLGDQVARHNARRLLAAVEAAAARDEVPNAEMIWETQLKTQPPGWVEDIRHADEAYGFVFFQAKELREEREAAYARWRHMFDGDFGDHVGQEVGYRRAASTVFGSEVLARHMCPAWDTEAQLSEKEPAAMRNRFREIRPLISKPRVLGNTFIVVSTDCVPSELDTRDFDWRDPHDVNRTFSPDQGDPNKVLPGDLSTLFVWAYDPEWTSPAQSDTVEGEEIDGSQDRSSPAKEIGDENEYQGRVKVDLSVLFSWFYYARLQGIDLKQLWSRAQTLPDRTWTCKAAEFDPSQPERLI